MNQQTALRLAIFIGVVSCGCRSLLAGDPTFDITSLVADSAVLVDGGSAGDRVGESAALSEGYLVVGAPGVDVDGVVDAGRVYVYDAAGTTLLYTLESLTPGAGDEFGESVATDGELIVIGARNDDEAGIDAGAVFVYEAQSGALISKVFSHSPMTEERFGATVAMNISVLFVCALNDPTAAMYGGGVEIFSRADLEHMATLYPSQPEVSASFGSSLAVTDSTLAIGSGRSDLGGVNSGAVHVFDLATLEERFTTIGSGTGAGDGFANALALSDERLFVGSPMDQGAGTDAGAVYVFDAVTGEELFQFVAPDTVARDSFGSGLSMEGELLAVGARRNDSASSNAGTAYLFNAETGRLLSRLEPESTATGDQFGNACAVHGETIFVSSVRSNANGNPAGAVHRFDLAGIRLADRDLRGVCHSLANDSFGEAIDAGDGLIVVGAPDAEYCLSSEGGAAYVFDIATGELVHTLDPAGTHFSDQFGGSVAIGDGVIAVGNPLSDMIEQNGGIVHLYDADSGQLIDSLSPEGLEVGDLFGSSLDIEAGVIAVGARYSSALSLDAGAVYLYDLGSLDLISVVGPPPGNRRNDEFGYSVKLHDGLLLVGSPHADPVLTNSGAAYVFQAATGELLHTLTAEDGGFNDEFGHSLAIRGGYIAVGAPGDFTNGFQFGGSAYVFDRKSGDQIVKLNSPNGEFTDRFGSSVGLDGDSVYLGMMRQAFEPGVSPNRVQRFDLKSFSLNRTYLPTFTQPDSGFGQTLAIDDGRLIVGMPNDTMYPGFEGIGGAVFVYDQPSSDTCAADFNADGVVNFFDVSAFIIAYTGGNPDADFTGDGALTFFDISGFILAYNAGCP